MHRVVLADDERHIRLMIKSALSLAGFEVVGEAANGREALEIYLRERPDLIMLDINMPLMTGDKALEAIVKEDPSALVVMLTSVSDMESVEACLALGASDFIRKDTPLPELVEIVRGVLQA